MRIAEIEKRCAGHEWRPCPKVLTSSRVGERHARRRAGGPRSAPDRSARGPGAALGLFTDSMVVTITPGASR